MKPETQRIAIAEACGWRVFTSGADGDFARPPLSMLPEWAGKDCPDYLADLNACAEFEATLADTDRLTDYSDWLDKIRSRGNRWDTFRSSASQRCEAFLRTIGKWEGAE